MQKRIFTLIFSSLLLVSSLSHADVILLKNTGPLTFATINGQAGLVAESLLGGSLTVDTGSSTDSTTLDPGGNYSLVTGAGRRFDIYTSYILDGLPNVNARIRGVRALAENEARTINLSRPSGRILGTVNVVGGTLDSISVSAFSQTAGADGLENYSSSQVKNRIGAEIPEVLLAMPAGIVTEVYVSARATSNNGCVVEKEFVKRIVVVRDILLSGSPDNVQWTLNVTGAACDNGNISGAFQFNGLNPASILNYHSLTFSGADSATQNLTAFGPWTSGPLTEGSYFILQTSYFNPPYGLLGFPVGSIDVSGNAGVSYDIVHSVGTAHGNLMMTGDWTLDNATSAEATSVGNLEPGSTNSATNIVAIDAIDPVSGDYDLVLTTGIWDFNRFDFAFDSTAAGIEISNELSLRLLPGAGLGAFNIAEGQHVDIAPLALNTSISAVTFQVEQQAGQPAVTIDQLDVLGNSLVLDTPADTVVQRADITQVISGAPQSEFDVRLYGLPGTYEIQATGIGSDGNLYEAVFELVVAQQQPQQPDPLACFAVNRMMVHQHDGKIYINKGAFALPEGAQVDLLQTDVVFTVDGLEYLIPAGSFRHDDGKYHYRSPHGQVPAIKAILDFSEYKWSLKVRDPQAANIDNSDGVDVGMAFAEFQGSENIVMTEKHKHYSHHEKHYRKKYDHHDDGVRLKYRRKPKVRCGPEQDDEHHNEHEDDHHGHGHADDNERKKCEKRNKGASRRHR